MRKTIKNWVILHLFSLCVMLHAYIIGKKLPIPGIILPRNAQEIHRYQVFLLLRKINKQIINGERFFFDIPKGFFPMVVIALQEARWEVKTNDFGSIAIRTEGEPPFSGW